MQLYLITTFLFFSFITVAILYLKLSKAKSPLKLGSYFFILHLFLILIFSIRLYPLLRADDLYYIYFVPLCILDLPISLLNGLISFLAENNIIHFSFNGFFLLYIFILALLGSIQYFIIGLFIGKLYRRFNRNPRRCI